MHAANSIVLDGKFPIIVNQDLAGFSAARPGRHRFSRLA